MYRQGELFAHLKHELESRGIVFRPRPVKEILDRLNQKQTQVRPVPANLHHASEIEWLLP